MMKPSPKSSSGASIMQRSSSEFSVGREIQMAQEAPRWPQAGPRERP